MNTIPDFDGPLPNGWTGGRAKTKWWRGKHVHLYRLEKVCAECKGTMQIDVTRDALEGRAKNAGLHLTRCAGCRAKAKALGLTSRPKVEGQEPPARTVAGQVDTFDVVEIVNLRTANATMRQELDGLYAQNRELRGRLAQYEINEVTLEDAMVDVARHAMDGSPLKYKPKMPWES